MPMFCYFYHDQYRWAVSATVVLILTNLFCLFTILFLVLQKPLNIYIPAEYSEIPSRSLAISDFSITPKIPLDQRNFTSGEINEWLFKVITQLFSYDLQNYPQQLRRNQAYFLPDAENQYLTLLNSLAAFSDYTQKDVIVSTVRLMGAPAIYDQGVANGRYFWVFDLPIDVTFSGNVNLAAQSITLRLIIVRTPMENDVDGIKIASITATKLQRKGFLPPRLNG